MEIYLTSKNLILEIPKVKMANKVLDYYIRNRETFKIWEPIRGEDFYKLKHHKISLKSGIQKAKAGTEYAFLIFSKEDSRKETVIGKLTFSSIVKGPFLSCFVGYSIDSAMQNKGYMTEALEAGVNFIFNTVGLHRIEANIMPRNIESLRVVEKLGFKNEGLSPKYLKINGVWDDHVHMVLRNMELEKT